MYKYSGVPISVSKECMMAILLSYAIFCDCVCECVFSSVHLIVTSVNLSLETELKLKVHD